MPDQQLSHTCIFCQHGCLCSCRVFGFGSQFFILVQEGGLMEQQVHTSYFRDQFRIIYRVGNIGIRSGAVRWKGQAGTGYYGTVRPQKVFPLFDPDHIGYPDPVLLYLILPDIEQFLFFAEKISKGGRSVPQGNGTHPKLFILINGNPGICIRNKKKLLHHFLQAGRSI